MANKQATGKKVSQEKAISTTLKEMMNSDKKMYYVLWKYAKNLLPDCDELKTFDDLKKHYKALQSDGLTQQFCENWLYEDNVQKAVKWLLQRLDTNKKIELYNTYFEKAKEDVQFFKAFSDISKDFLKDDKEGKLQSLLQNVDIPDDEDDTEE
jgi:hypothetical protein